MEFDIGKGICVCIINIELVINFNTFRNGYHQERYYRLRANFLHVAWTPEELANLSQMLWYGQTVKNYDYEDNRTMKLGGGAGSAEADSSNSMPEYAVLGDDLGQALEEADVRSDFRETALWIPGTEIEDGVYSWELILPDNLAKWRVKVIASTRDCLGWMETMEFNSSKDFFIAGLMY